MNMLTAREIWFDDSRIFVTLNDGRIIGTPLAWFKNLKKGTPEQMTNFELWDNGGWIHWEELDEDLSVEGLLALNGRVFID